MVTGLLLENFDDIFDMKYTATMEEELDEIESGKIAWRAAIGEFYEKFDKDLKHAEEHMTDIKRMEKPTDLTCEKCGKPLVIKWGKHGSFHRLHRISRFSLPQRGNRFGKTAEGYCAAPAKSSAAKSTQTSAEGSGALSRSRDPPGLSKTDFAGSGGPVPKAMKAAFEKHRKDIAGTEAEGSRTGRAAPGEDPGALSADRTTSMTWNCAARTKDRVLSWQRKEGFCTYTRELTVDLPDVEGASLSEQGDEEYCENCGRPMVLKKGRFGTFFACTGYPDCKTTKRSAARRRSPTCSLTRSARSAAATWC